jgi:hypothetical protein
VNTRFHSHNNVVILRVSYVCCDEKWLEVISFWVTVVSPVLYFELEGVIKGIYCSLCHPEVFHVIWNMCHKNLGYGSQVAHHFILYSPLAELIPIKECHLAQYQTFFIKTISHREC